jgi:hypothetical protein
MLWFILGIGSAEVIGLCYQWGNRQPPSEVITKYSMGSTTISGSSDLSYSTVASRLEPGYITRREEVIIRESLIVCFGLDALSTLEYRDHEWKVSQSDSTTSIY